MIKDKKKLLPLDREQTYYYLPLEEAQHQIFKNELEKGITVKTITPTDIAKIPSEEVVIIGLHKDNSTPYKSHKISKESKKTISHLAKKNRVVLNVFGSPYSLRNIDIKKFPPF